MKKMLAKFYVASVLKSGYPDAEGRPQTTQIRPTLAAVGPRGDEGDLSDENNRYHKYTPQGEITITVDNPSVFDFFAPGQEIYVTFEKMEAEDASASEGSYGGTE